MYLLINFGLCQCLLTTFPLCWLQTNLLCSVFVIRLGSLFTVVAGGELEHDGENLVLVGNGVRRLITDDELAGLMLVNPDSRIAECHGFDLFLIEKIAADQIRI